MPARRWYDGRTVGVGGVRLRTVTGRHLEFDDLRVEMWTNGKWLPVSMSLAFALVDAFSENERHRQVATPWWRENGDSYFMRHCHIAVKEGYEVPTEMVRRQRQNRETP